MSAINNRKKKREIQFTPAHNRKAGSGKFWKHYSNRKARRKGHKYNKEIVENRLIYGLRGLSA